MSVRPKVFIFRIHRAFQPTTAVEVRGGNLVVSSLSPEGVQIPGSRYQLTPPTEYWAEFRKALDFVDVWSWSPRYSNPNCRDGQAWSLHIEHLDRSVTSEGTNGYPSFISPSEMSPDEERFGMFVGALGKLLSHSWDLTSRGTIHRPSPTDP